MACNERSPLGVCPNYPWKPSVRLRTIVSEKAIPPKETDRYTEAVVATREPLPEPDVIARHLERVLLDLGEMRRRVERLERENAELRAGSA